MEQPQAVFFVKNLKGVFMEKINFPSKGWLSSGQKNFLTVFSALVFGVSVLGLSVMRVSQSEVMAQGEGENEVEVIEIGEGDGSSLDEISDRELSNTEDIEEKVDYYLPYPGILPDHPLYWLKMFRDRIMLTLTKNPVDKYGRLLLYADKRVGAAKVLVEGGKAELGVTTATKAGKYLEQAINEFKGINDPGKATPEERERLLKAGMKHEEVLNAILDKVPDQSRPALQDTIGKIKELYLGLSDL